MQSVIRNDHSIGSTRPWITTSVYTCPGASNITETRTCAKRTRWADYYTRQDNKGYNLCIYIYDTGTVMIQGENCSTWESMDFQPILQLVNKMVTPALHDTSASPSSNRSPSTNLTPLPDSRSRQETASELIRKRAVVPINLYLRKPHSNPKLHHCLLPVQLTQMWQQESQPRYLPKANHSEERKLKI